MSIFDFLFARGATPEQRNKNIFLDMIDGGGRFDADDDFKGGPMGISALLNALGVNPYGSSDAQPQDKPQGLAFAPRPASGPARSLRPRLRPAQQMPDELLTERFGTFALGTPSEIETTVLPRRGHPGHAFSRGDSAAPAFTSGHPGYAFSRGDSASSLGLLAPQLDPQVAAVPEVDYLAAAMQYPEFERYVDAKARRNFTRGVNPYGSLEQLARQFLEIAEAEAPAASSSADPYAHPEWEIQRMMDKHGFDRRGAINVLNIGVVRRQHSGGS